MLSGGSMMGWIPWSAKVATAGVAKRLEERPGGGHRRGRSGAKHAALARRGQVRGWDAEVVHELAVAYQQGTGAHGAHAHLVAVDGHRGDAGNVKAEARSARVPRG
jgi:hypothetical protein